jgi:hypothetical protein
MKNKIYFLTILLLYFLVFWILPLFIFNPDSIFSRLEDFLSLIGLGSINSFALYLIFIIPVCCLFIKKFFLKTSSLFIFFALYILLPYSILGFFTYYAYLHLFDNFNPIG